MFIGSLTSDRDALAGHPSVRGSQLDSAGGLEAREPVAARDDLPKSPLYERFSGRSKRVDGEPKLPWASQSASTPRPN